MISNKACVLFPATNLIVWLVVGGKILFAYTDMYGVVFFPMVIILGLNFGLIKLTCKVPYDKLKILNVTASAAILLVVFSTMLVNTLLAGILFMILLFGGVFYILLMTNSFHGNFNFHRSVCRSMPQSDGERHPVRINGHHKNATSINQTVYSHEHNLPVVAPVLNIQDMLPDKAISSLDYNPANGLPMMDNSFDVLGNVHGTSGTHDMAPGNSINYVDMQEFNPHNSPHDINNH